MEKQVVIIGLGRFGISLANSLTSIGLDVLALDINEQKVQSVAAKITHAVHADATDETVLDELGVRNFDIAVVAIGSDIQSSVLATVLLKKLGISYVVARANNMLHGEILKKIGADKVVFPEYESGIRASHEVLLRGVLDYFPVAPRYGITSIEAHTEFIDQSLTKLGFGPKSKDNIAVLIIRRGNEIIINPSMSEIIKPGDELIVAGSDKNLEALLARLAINGNGKQSDSS
jgi:trk system potassium uptake protein TrkA